ncbi:MAG: hypothetical protein KDA75_19655 [Planctomycetaceae bacterium]|nr:hypothetical protein [Planctomycetaceae bacterium]
MQDRLKIAVERIVRPVDAPATTKLRMREELFAHLLAVQAEEASRGGSDEEVMKRSLERLGGSDVLTSELQASLPWHERHERRMNRWFGKRDGETPVAFAVRYAASVFVLAGVSIALALLGRALFGASRPMAHGAAFGMVAMFVIDAFVLALLGTWCGERVDPPARPVWRQLPIWLAALAGGACVTIVGLGLMVIASRGLDIPGPSRLQWAVLGMVTIAGFLTVLTCYQLERRKLAEWDRLDLTVDEAGEAPRELA